MIYLVIILGIVAMALSQISPRHFKYGLESAWLLIFIFLAIRYDFGNDYYNYQYIFNDIASASSFAYDDTLHFEKGWQVLCWIFKPVGFYGMVFVLTAFECYVYYRIIKQYVPQKYYWLSIFLFVFSPGLMLIGASMMRNQLAIAIFLCSVKFIFERRIIPYLLLIYLATTIHRSAIILYPIFLLGFIRNLKISNITVYIILIGYIVLSYLGPKLSPIVEQLAILANMQETYEVYSTNTRNGISYGIGSVIQFVILTYSLFIVGRLDSKANLICILFLLGNFIEPFSATVPMVARFIYYFSCFAILLYPITLNVAVIPLKRNVLIVRHGVMLLLIFITLYSFYSFFQDPVWIKAYSSYKTIFSVV